MTNNSEQSSSTTIAEKRRPVTAAQCVFNIVLYGAYGWALARFALHHSGWSLFLFGLWGFMNFSAALYWVYNLRRIRSGDRAEYIFTPVKERKTFMDVLYDCFGYIVNAVMITGASIYLLCSPGPASFAGVATILLANIAAWRGVYHACMRDRAYKKEPNIRFSSEEAAEQAKALEKAPVAVGATGERIAAGHWWTDTQTREENKVSAGR